MREGDAWMKLQAEALYKHDEHGRLLCNNDMEQTEAPFIFIGKTSKGSIVRARHDVPEQLFQRIQDVVQSADRINLIELTKHIEKLTSVKKMWLGPAYRFPQSLQFPLQYLSTAVITESNRDLLAESFPDWDDCLELSPVVAVLDREGRAVSICCSSRTTDVVCEAGLETAATARGQGYAPAAVVAWAQEVRRMGKEPLYSTSWDNLSSQRVAQKLGLILYGTDISFYV